MSIRTRLFLGITYLIVFFVALSLLLNTQFLGKYYIWQKKQTLITSKNKIDDIYKGNPDVISFELEKMERNESLNIVIIGRDLEQIYGSFGNGMRRSLPILRSIDPGVFDLSKGDIVTDIVVDPRLNTKFLTLFSRLNNGDSIILSTPLAAINESAAIANRFLLFTGLFIIILGSIGIFIFAKRFTRPILELSDIAQSMARLDFSKKYNVRSDDEIGQLGKSINSLSDQLDEAIRDLQESNSKLQEDIEQKRRIDEMRKEFISNVSHELKTPIALIQGYAEGLKLNVNEDEENKNFYCDVIMDETGKMNKLVKELLDLSQIDSGQLELEKNVFNIIALVDHVLDKYRPILADRGIRVEINYHAPIDVVADKVKIEQVLVNYLNNAIDYVDGEKLIKIIAEDRGDKTRVTVFNTGKNIPPEEMEKIWTSFYKVDKARTRAYGGTGLGLSVVKAIMERHNNAYGAENETGGVSFWFEIDNAKNLAI